MTFVNVSTAAKIVGAIVNEMVAEGWEYGAAFDHACSAFRRMLIEVPS